MSDFAAVEYCQELFKLSGWDDTEYVWAIGEPDGDSVPTEYSVYLDDHGDHRSIRQSVARGKYWDDAISAYDLGYLLRKLPDSHLELTKRGYDEYWDIIWYHRGKDGKNDVEQNITCTESTPEDATAKLCIALWKAGLLK